jgi:hypothetical protein
MQCRTALSSVQPATVADRPLGIRWRCANEPGCDFCIQWQFETRPVGVAIQKPYHF